MTQSYSESAPSDGSAAASASQCSEPPLCVDLDGTLLRTDVFVEGLVELVGRRPWDLLLAPLWLLRGRAHFKHEVASRATIDPAALPYHQPLLACLAEYRAAGRKLLLVTGANERNADRIAQHLGIFDQVISGDRLARMTGRQKRDRLVNEFGAAGFDYIGNSRADLPVWRAARSALLVNCPATIARRAREGNNVVREFYDRPAAWPAWLGMSPISEWLANLLVFVPLVFASHVDAERLSRTFVAFLSLNCLALAVGIAADLLAVASHRRDELRRARPFAAGHLDLAHGLVAVFVAGFFGIGLAALVGIPVAAAVVVVAALAAVARYVAERAPGWETAATTAVNVARVATGAIACDVVVSKPSAIVAVAAGLAASILGAVVGRRAAARRAGR